MQTSENKKNFTLLREHKIPSHMGFVRRSLAVLVALSGIISILGSVRLLHAHVHFNVWFGPATAWFYQHNIVIGFLFLFLARQIYQGERTAYRLSVGLTVLQVIKYSVFQPHIIPYSIFGILLIILLLSKDYFVRHSSPRRFIGRLKGFVFAVVCSVAVITLLGIIYRIGKPSNLKNSSFSATRIVMRVTLLEYNSDKVDPLPARLFGQVLTAAGFSMYAWILAGLFSPALFSRAHADAAEQERMFAMLQEYGKSSEDSFKLWPEDKQYWFNDNDTAGIAYKQYKGVVIALESPVGSAHAKTRASIAFRNYCRQHGWKLVWLFADSDIAEEEGFKSLKIGANAVVKLDSYANDTIGNKWWRWIRNKNRKLGLQYEQLVGPLNPVIVAEIKNVSDAWLRSNNHNEWTFALGYFDEDFIHECIIHVLKNEHGRIVAFANQLPSFNNNTQATIDLMRALPEYDGAVTYLLSEALLNMHAAGQYKTFDLGFVPLAQTEEATTKKAVLTLTKTLFNAYFSARGLRQFKNKFDPTWHDNYLAWDGDWLDLPAVAQAVDKILAYNPTKIDQTESSAKNVNV